MYCGDDVSSTVIDLGSFHTRAGYSGEDCPRSVIPSIVGIHEGSSSEDPKQDAEMVDEQQNSKNNGNS